MIRRHILLIICAVIFNFALQAADDNQKSGQATEKPEWFVKFERAYNHSDTWCNIVRNLPEEIQNRLFIKLSRDKVGIRGSTYDYAVSLSEDIPSIRYKRRDLKHILHDMVMDEIQHGSFSDPVKQRCLEMMLVALYKMVGKPWPGTNIKACIQCTWNRFNN